MINKLLYLILILFTLSFSLTGCSRSYSLTIQVIPSDSGQVINSPSDNNYKAGKTVNLEAIAANGMVFENWSGNITSTNPSIQVTMDADKSITANFMPLIIGKWLCSFENQEIMFEFNNDGTVEQTARQAGWKYVFNYKLDYTFDPICIDFTFEPEIARTILEFIDDNTLRMEFNTPADIRPDKFSNTETTVILKRVDASS
jgi:hypothetical protein